jgi:hypothetical protein
MILTGKTRSTQRKTFPVPLRLPQIPHGLSWDPGAHPEFLIGNGLTLTLYACNLSDFYNLRYQIMP